MKDLKFLGDRIITGPGSLKYIAEIKEKRVFIVTGKAAMFKNGVMDRLQGMLSGKAIKIYQGISQNPDVEAVITGTRVMKDFAPEVVIAVGGGSVIDAAKVMTLLCEYESLNLMDIRAGKAPKKREKLRLIAIPSTSGTAAEVTRAAVITFPEENIKVGLKTESFIPDLAILDGQLTLSMPKSVMVESGMDALTHALEAYINKNADDFSKAIAKGAFEGLIMNLRASFYEGDIESRQHVHNYQCLAGFAFQNAGLGMDHGIAHSLGGRFGTSHGLLNAIALPYVMKYNIRDEQVNRDLAALSKAIDKDVIEEIISLNQEFGVPKSFKDAGIDEQEFLTDYPLILDNALKGSTVRNPVSMNAEEMDKVIKSIYYGEIRF
ncbi:iron-containing alcohol dehydrogenase [Eubacteriaceae bacterium ES2]|nr:iron-containing alcohol dehydrogenase [Eubacteriaceae bacterium ES2]